MKKDWTYKKLIDVCGIQYGCPFDSKCFTEDNTYPALIRIRDVVRGYTETFYKGDVPEEYYVQKGEYLIGMDGEFNIAPWRSEKALLNQRVCKIFSITSNVDIQFVYYSLQRQLKQIEDETPFVTVKHLSAKRLNQIELPIPPLSIQRSIVAELDLLHSVISKKKEQLRELDNLAQSLFYQMFGDPITNPMGWEIKKLGEVFEIGSGGTPAKNKSEYWDNGDIPWIGSNMCQNSIVYQTDGKFITRSGLEHSSAKLLPSDTVLVALVGATIGKVALLKTPSATNQNIAFIKSHEEFSPIFVFYHLMNQYEEFMNIGNGDFKMATQGFIKGLPIILPPLSLQQSFAAKVSAIEAQKQTITQSIHHTEALLAQRMDQYFG